ncbi:MAG: hypothetical protein KAT66_00525 [Candidatus Lokiarchaeota archaeon]|nr:hypothetical protein [Candidatus Lokiarchaeota archaeon]
MGNKKGYIPWNKGLRGYECKHKKLIGFFSRIVVFVKKGKDTKDIASILNISPITVRSILKRKNAKEELKVLKIRGKVKRDNQKVTKKDIEKMISLSEKGRGIDYIGKVLSYDGTTIRRYLIKELGEKQYKKRHNIKRYSSYWSGKYWVNERGDRIQSSLEENVIDYLYEKNIAYKTQVCLVFPERRIYPDIQLLSSDIYIEVYGMSDLAFYKIKMNEKKALYKKYNLSVISLYKSDFDKSDSWKNKLKNL